ncbi:hypothetical protein LEMLEM_LOCUS16246, partial [Lemmus lemmus]
RPPPANSCRGAGQGVLSLKQGGRSGEAAKCLGYFSIAVINTTVKAAYKKVFNLDSMVSEGSSPRWVSKGVVAGTAESSHLVRWSEAELPHCCA